MNLSLVLHKKIIKVDLSLVNLITSRFRQFLQKRSIANARDDFFQKILMLFYFIHNGLRRFTLNLARIVS